MQPRLGIPARLMFALLLSAFGAWSAASVDADSRFSVSAAVSPDAVVAGATATITVQVRNGGRESHPRRSPLIVDMEVVNSRGTKVFQQYVRDNTFDAGEVKTFQWFWRTPATQAAGTYTVRVGLFSDDWTTLIAWNNSADTFTIAPAHPGVAFAIGNITASPTTVQPGGRVSVTASVTNVGGAAASNVNVLLHFADPLGHDFPDNQVIVSGQSFTAGQTRTLAFQWTAPANAAPGKYSLGIGVFNASWSQRYAWKSSPAAFTLGTVRNPTFAVGTTTVSPNPVGRGQTLTVTTNVHNTSTLAAANIIVLCEINDVTDSHNITSQNVTGLSFSPGQNRALGFAFTIPSTLAPGTYTIDVGVFNSDWSLLYTWGYLVARFTVR